MPAYQNTSIKNSFNRTKLVYIACLYDTTNFKWVEEIFKFAVDLINDHDDGWFDDVLNDGTNLVTTVASSACDERASLSAYLRLRTDWGDPLHGVVGCRCSDDTAAVALVAGLEGIPVVSPSASSSDLTNDSDEFSSFSRLVGPDNERGQVGALVSLLRSMGWDRVSILATDSKYTTDLATAFGNAWVGSHEADASGKYTAWTGAVAYHHTIALTANNTYVDEASVKRALLSAPTGDPRRNSRVILLLAHQYHAYFILRLASEMSFQPDTVWIGTDSWSGRAPKDADVSWMPPVPGYLGIVPYRNREGMLYMDFLERLRVRQTSEDRTVIDDLPDYSAERLVDSLLALSMALSSVGPEQRGDGGSVARALRNASFSGLSGPVRFTSKGDLADPRYSVVNWQQRDGPGWVDVGVVGPSLGSANVSLKEICWAEFGCGLSTPPSDKPLVPPLKQPAWVWAVISVLVVTVLGGLHVVHRLRRSKRMIRDFFEQHREVAEAKRIIEAEISQKEREMQELKRRLTYLIQQPRDPQDVPSTWATSYQQILVEVFPHEAEYWTVSGKLRETMDDAWISNLFRIQNRPLWMFYNFHKKRLLNSGANDNEVAVWHGTRRNDPSLIYNDLQDGFLMQFAQEGLWGRGIYFAEKSSYSDEYAYCPREIQEKSLQTGEERTQSERNDQRELFLAKLLVGREIFIEQPAPDLKIPPIDPATSQRYNTVYSYIRGKGGIATKVWIVYENGRAYPDYLVRYYRGVRDSARTPYASREDQMHSCVAPSK